jgi:dUTP pyrophosphatase
MKIKIKKLHPNAQIPTYAKAGDAGMDITAITKTWDEFDNVVYGTGIAIEIPEGYVGLLFPRSSNAKKRTLLSNSVGIIDSGYRGELIFKFKVIDKLFSNSSTYAIGDRIGQLIVLPYPKVEFEEVTELSITERGEGGFGSTNM